MEFKPKLEMKRWSKEIEKKMLETWEKEWSKIYSFNINSKKPIFVIDTPPPYVAPFWHIGAAISYAMQDMIARIFRMLGFEVLYPIGLDRNGIPIEWYVEKYEGLSIAKTPREEFLKRCKELLDEYSIKMLELMKRFLISGDFENVYMTDSEQYRKITQATFIELWKKGLIYKDLRPSNYCPRCKTVIADNEVLHEKRKTKLVYIKFKIKRENQFITIATTRPELLGACKLIIFNPNDERWKKFEGKIAIVPLYGLEVPIKARNEANPEFGSGALMVCSYGDLEDVKILREEKIEPTIIIDENGIMKDKLLNGLTIKRAREKIVKLLKESGYIEKIEEIEHNVPIHDKCRTEIEILALEEFYLKQMDFLKDLLEIQKEIKWHPEFHRQKLIDWINSVSIDWPISRRRFYGTEIPIWYCKKCGYIYVPEGGKYYQPWRENPDIEKCPKCGANEWIGETRIFDTWMDSSISILFITKYMQDEEFFKKTFENGIKLRPQGYDIIRTWLYYTLLRVYQLIGKKAFDHIFINGMGLDEKGRKMSKSLGNVIEPEEVLNEIGAEPLRLWAAMECTIGSDYRVSKEKIKGTSKFLTKLINIARYISQFPLIEEWKNLEKSDEWIINYWFKIKKDVIENYRDFDFHLAAQSLYKFVWDIFASHYIELSKKRAMLNGFGENEAKSAWFTLHFILKEILKMFAPIIPATTDFIYRKLYGKSVHLEEFGEIGEIDENLIEIGEKLIEFNSKVWNLKKEKGKSLKDKIEIEIPSELKDFEKDLIAMHNIISSKQA
ncbi:MAG: valine--tRNA ligase [Candidatus Aenigmarchaeota archaeon ex4484_224]|nr:MAG: valine--tRNA ligase [Candidatus Aenigmarchaeota archaeon ex4484_224]